MADGALIDVHAGSMLWVAVGRAKRGTLVDAPERGTPTHHATGHGTIYRDCRTGTDPRALAAPVVHQLLTGTDRAPRPFALDSSAELSTPASAESNHIP